ncbi:MAG TPA: oxygen-independent coproporphyrinogen III oxidase [Candidatus Hydrogenedentes bacterium]|nr:oxygen-independent coproporphyrinogen III oxidase [Candidatus Hydrogenedentota bacterium]
MKPSTMILPSKELVREMDVAAPRYTSYPAIPVWHPAESGAAYADVLQRHSSDIPLTLYFHVPFCPVICHYCGCNTAKLEREEQTAEYVESVLREIQLAGSLLPERHRIAQIHWGGGTPSILQDDEFLSVMRRVRESFDVYDQAELAIETNPMTCSDKKIRFLLDNGFNRISIGVQDFDPEVQQKIGRCQTHERTAEFCRLVREYDVRSLNFDLVYGLPGQTLKKAEDTLAKVVDLAPDRIAVYSFAFLPTLRDNQKKIDKTSLPDTDLKFDLYLLTIERLQQAGYEMIGMDHYAKPEDELAVAWRERRLRRNFMGYTTKAETDVVAFGATAISDVSGYYCQNEKDNAPYYERIKNGDLPVQRHMSLDADDQIRRKVIMDLLCNGVVVKQEVSKRFSIDVDDYFSPELARLTPLAAKDLVRNDPSVVEATILGRFFLRNLALVFDNYLDGRKGPQRGTTFSRTV